MLADDILLPRLHRRPIEFRNSALDAKFLAIAYEVINLGVVEQGLGWNATHIQAGAPQPVVFFDHGCLETPLRRADGRHISSRAAAQDYQIKVFCHRGPLRGVSSLPQISTRSRITLPEKSFYGSRSKYRSLASSSPSDKVSGCRHSGDLEGLAPSQIRRLFRPQMRTPIDSTASRILGLRLQGAASIFETHHILPARIRQFGNKSVVLKTHFGT